MKKILFTAIIALLLISSFFVSSATADNVTITIKGGFGCNVIIQNNENSTIKANVSIISHRIFISGGTNITGTDIPIMPGMSFTVRALFQGINSIYAMAQVSNQTLIRKGMSIFNFVILFR